ncbi:MAG: hypothetical protein QM579_13595 [Desulfovibrio sp.]|uniref:hypothetical protein n=1 Tax=Desulfovibrio sp. TaxID=885 RepID=UPI0039E3A464
MPVVEELFFTDKSGKGLEKNTGVSQIQDDFFFMDIVSSLRTIYGSHVYSNR